MAQRRPEANSARYRARLTLTSRRPLPVPGTPEYVAGPDLRPDSAADAGTSGESAEVPSALENAGASAPRLALAASSLAGASTCDATVVSGAEPDLVSREAQSSPPAVMRRAATPAATLPRESRRLAGGWSVSSPSGRAVSRAECVGTTGMRAAAGWSGAARGRRAGSCRGPATGMRAAGTGGASASRILPAGDSRRAIWIDWCRRRSARAMRSRSASRNILRSSSTRGPAVRRSGGRAAGDGSTFTGRHRVIAAEMTCDAGRDRKRSSACRNSSADANAGRSISPRARAINSSSGPGTRGSASPRPKVSSRCSSSAYCAGVAGAALAALGRCTVPSPRITMSSRRFGGSDQPRRSATASVRATASSGERVPPSPARSERVSACCSCPMRPCHSEMGATLREMETRTEQGGDGARASRFCAIVTANDSKCGQLCLESEPSGSVWSRRCYMPDPNTRSRNAAGTWKLGPPVGDHAAKITSSCGRAAPRGRLMR